MQTAAATTVALILVLLVTALAAATTARDSWRRQRRRRHRHVANGATSSTGALNTSTPAAAAAAAASVLRTAITIVPVVERRILAASSEHVDTTSPNDCSELNVFSCQHANTSMASSDDEETQSSYASPLLRHREERAYDDTTVVDEGVVVEGKRLPSYQSVAPSLQAYIDRARAAAVVASAFQFDGCARPLGSIRFGDKVTVHAVCNDARAVLHLARSAPAGQLDVGDDADESGGQVTTLVWSTFKSRAEVFQLRDLSGKVGDEESELRFGDTFQLWTEAAAHEKTRTFSFAGDDTTFDRRFVLGSCKDAADLCCAIPESRRDDVDYTDLTVNSAESFKIFTPLDGHVVSIGTSSQNNFCCPSSDYCVTNACSACSRTKPTTMR
jgi:hypothetical protein